MSGYEKYRGSVLRACVAAAALVVWASPAYAYLDPGTGSYALQILLAALFGALFTIKVYWQKLKAFFTGRKAETEKDAEEK